MDVLVIGAGPAGLAFAIARAEQAPDDRIVVVDRRAEDADPGFGVTLRLGAFDVLGLGELVQGPALQGRALWYRGERIVDLPNPDAGHLVTMGRATLTGAMVRRAKALGVTLQWGVDGSQVGFEDHDLVVAADGAGSGIRRRLAASLKPEVREGDNVFAWLGTTRVFPKLSVLLRDDEIPLLGWAYQYDEGLSTLIVEVSGDTFARTGIEHDTVATLSRVLAGELEGHPVLAKPEVRWRRFPTIRCERLFHDNVVLIGDAAHTTHFSQGFGTLFALDDALALAEALASRGSIGEATRAYQASQQPKVEAHQATCNASMQWGVEVTRALDAHDEIAVRRLVDARWSGNAVAPAPLDPR